MLVVCMCVPPTPALHVHTHTQSGTRGRAHLQAPCCPADVLLRTPTRPRGRRTDWNPGEGIPGEDLGQPCRGHDISSSPHGSSGKTGTAECPLPGDWRDQPCLRRRSPAERPTGSGVTRDACRRGAAEQKGVLLGDGRTCPHLGDPRNARPKAFRIFHASESFYKIISKRWIGSTPSLVWCGLLWG